MNCPTCGKPGYRRPMSIKEIVGANIRERREKLGFSQKEFAELIGVHASHLCNVEQGKDGLGMTTYGRVCEELEVPYPALMVHPEETTAEPEKPSENGNGKVRHNTFAQHVGPHLKEIREARGLNYKEMAELFGVSYKHYNNVEEGRTNPSVRMLERGARRLGVKLTAIVGDFTGPMH